MLIVLSGNQNMENTMSNRPLMTMIHDVPGKINEFISDHRLLIFGNETITIERIHATYQYLTHRRHVPVIGMFMNHYHIMEETLGPLNITHGFVGSPNQYTGSRSLGVGWELKLNYRDNGAVISDCLFILSGGEHPLWITKVWGIYSPLRTIPALRVLINKLFSEDGRIWRVKFNERRYNGKTNYRTSQRNDVGVEHYFSKLV